jgi:hypothetical protein
MEKCLCRFEEFIDMQKKKDKVTARLPRRARKKRGRGKPFAPGNPWRFPLGVSGNPGGRKRLIDADFVALGTIDPVTNKTIAQLISEKMCELAIAGDVAARRELRQATEGDTIHTPDIPHVRIDR